MKQQVHSYIVAAFPQRGFHFVGSSHCISYTFWKERVRKLPGSEILLWATHEAPPRALQTSECDELLNPTRTSCVILVQRQPGKLEATYMRPRRASLRSPTRGQLIMQNPLAL